MLEDLGLIAEPDPQMIESLFRVTSRNRTPWDAETLLMMVIARDAMARKATDKNCEQPYREELTDQEQEDNNESVVSSFFSRYKTA